MLLHRHVANELSMHHKYKSRAETNAGSRVWKTGHKILGVVQWLSLSWMLDVGYRNYANWVNKEDATLPLRPVDQEMTDD